MPTEARPLPLTRICGGRPPLTVAAATVAVLGGLGSLLLPLGADAAEVYRAGVQLWTTAVTVGYVLWFQLYDVDRLRVDLAVLAPLLPSSGSAESLDAFALNRHPATLFGFTVAGGLFGLVFNVLIGGTLRQVLSGETPTWAYAWSPPLSVLLWSLVFHAFWVLIDNTRLLARIGEHALRVDPNDVGVFDVFADVGARHFLMLVGGLAVFPIQGILGGGLAVPEVLPGVAIVVPVAFFLFAWPVRAVRRAIRRACVRELAAIDDALRQVPHLGDRYLLLSLHRRQVAAIPAWPVRLRSLARLALYLVIPPLAWVAAALVDTLVSRYV